MDDFEREYMNDSDEEVIPKAPAGVDPNTVANSVPKMIHF
jgi:hypothetical protein